MPESARALRAVYTEAQREIESSPSLSCELSGRCCRFREADHELFLTRLEYVEMVAQGGTPPDRPDGACPWLDRGLCANRDGRALACRTYFCSDEAESARVTERGHQRIRALHARYGIPYLYRSLFEHRNSEPEISSEES